MNWHYLPSTSSKWSNQNVIDGVLEGTYGKRFKGIVVDIGANVGAFSILAGEMADKVYAYEPATANYDCFLENIKESGLKNIVPIKKALGFPGTRTLNLNSVNSGAYSFYKNVGGGTEEVDCISLQQVFDDNNLDHIDYLKVDCEGGEWEFLLNNPLVSKIEHIRMESHNDLKDGSHPEWTYEKMVEFLEKSGFKVQVFPAHTPTCLTIWADKI